MKKAMPLFLVMVFWSRFAECAAPSAVKIEIRHADRVSSFELKDDAIRYESSSGESLTRKPRPADAAYLRKSFMGAKLSEEAAKSCPRNRAVVRAASGTVNACMGKKSANRAELRHLLQVIRLVWARAGRG